jgi:predicted MarR family transcription regulator
MTYDLRRLRRKGLVQRLEHSHAYTLTPQGIRVAVFYTKVYKRVLAPLIAAGRPPAPFELNQAIRVIERHVADYIDRARLQYAA